MPSLLLVLTLATAAAAHALDLPLHPDETRVLHAIIETEGVAVVPGDLPGYARKHLFATLESYGLNPKTLGTGGIALKDKPAVFLAFVHTAEGRVVALHGNGPWLRNSSLRALKAMPELRGIRIDHNGFVGKDPRAPEFDGSGFDTLADSKLAEIKIGLGFSDKGMEQCARIRSLRSFTVAHSRVTGAGIAFFAGHSGLTEFSVAEMASNRVTGKALADIAKIPNLTKVGFKECYVTYDDGFAHLAPLKGQLTEIDLSMSLASPADLAKLQADHPEAKILTLPPEEIVKRHKFIAANLAKLAPPQLAAPLRAALGQ